MDTERLIQRLVEGVEPVRPLAPPWQRAAWWACAAAMYLALLIVVVPPRIDPTARLQDFGFLVEQGAALLTGMAAAFAALVTAVPGYRRSVMWVPVVSATVWIIAVSVRAFDGVSFSAATLQADWHCVPATIVGSAMPAAAMALMLRRGVPLTPRLTGALGALAGGGVGNIGICFFRPHASSFSVLAWHIGTVALLAIVAGLISAKWLGWPTRRGALLGH